VSRRRVLGLMSASALGTSFFAAATGAQPLAAVDEPWLQGLNGKHRQFFDAGNAGGGKPLGRVAGFFDTYRDAYGLLDRDLSVLFGAHSTGLALVLGDAIWAKYSIGARYGLVNAAAGGAPYVRNVFATDAAGGNPKGASVEALTARGVRFLACQRSINRLAGELAAGRAAAVEEIRRELASGLLPGVTVVPAMIVAANRAQESGLAYTSLG
jgi:intracellular sulfur oxidation DsrE/DsrF family protein